MRETGSEIERRPTTGTRGQWLRRWRRRAGDIVVVVVGILIAFMLDSWWTGRTADAREEAHLRALRSDFERNIERLENEIRGEEAISEASRRLLLLARSGRSPDPDSLRRTLGTVFSSTRFEPVMGAYEAVVNSGGLTQIRDDSLRMALANFAATLDQPHVEELSDRLYIDFIRSATGRLGFLVDAVAADDGAIPALSLESALNLLHDPGFQEGLALRYAQEGDVAGRYRYLAQQAEGILHRIDRSLMDL